MGIRYVESMLGGNNFKRRGRLIGLITNFSAFFKTTCLPFIMREAGLRLINCQNIAISITFKLAVIHSAICFQI